MKKAVGKIALVTGAGRRLGRAIALALARQGFTVLVHYHSSGRKAAQTLRLVRKVAPGSASLRADLRRPAAIRRMVGAVVRRFGRIDLLVNNAGIFRPDTLMSVTETSWDSVLDANLKSAFFCTQEVGKVMKKQKGGRIINIGSVGAEEAWTGYIPYSVAKTGVHVLTRAAAKALAPEIAVNAIAPGFILLPGEERAGAVRMPLGRIPLGRYGTPEDITSMVVYLAVTSQYITGQIIAVDGGRSLL